MDLFQILIAVIGLLFSLAAVFAGIGYFGQGKIQANLDMGNTKLNTNTLLKEQIDALEDKVDRQSGEITHLTEKVEALTKEIEIRDKKFAEAILILNGKDPQMAEFIKSGTNYMLETKPVMEDLKLFLHKQIL